MKSVSLPPGEGRDGGATLVLRIDGNEQRIACPSGSWKNGRAAFGPLMPEQPAAASGAWVSDDTFRAKVCFYETPFILTLNLQFSGDEAVLTAEANVGFGATKQPRLVGKAK